MRCAARLLASTVSLALACSPTSGPEGGGQTGDPGVADFISIDANDGSGPGLPPDGGGSCRGGVQVIEEGQRLYSQSLQVRRLDETHLVVLDPRRGLAIVEATAAELRIVGTLTMQPFAGMLQVAGRTAFLSRRNLRPWLSYFANGYPAIGDDAALLAIDLSDLSAPEITAELTLPAAPRASFLTASEGRVRVHVLSDAGAANGCDSQETERQLTGYAWSDGRFVERSSLALGTALSEVQQVGDKLALKYVGGSLSFVSLAEADDSLRESATFPLTSVGAIHGESENTWRVVSNALDGVHVATYDLSNPQAIARLEDCVVGNAHADAGVAFSPQHTFLLGGTRWQDRRNTVTSARFNADGTCAVHRQEGNRRRVVVAGARVLDVDSDAERGMVARLLDDADLRVLGEVALPLATPLLGDLSVKSPPDEGPGLLAVRLGESLTATPALALQLFSFDQSSIRAAGTVSGVWRLEPSATTATLAWTNDALNAGALTRLDLSTPAEPKLSAEAQAAPGYVYLWSSDRHWLRVRGVERAYRGAEISDEELFAPAKRAQIEVVPIERDPDRGSAVARVEVNPRARIFKAGSRLVAITTSRNAGVSAQIEIFDLENPEQPVRSAQLSSDVFALPEPRNSREDPEVGLLTLPNALVRLSGWNRLPSLRVLDVSDPSQPHETEPITLPTPTGLALSAFAQGSSVYYSYREDAGSAGSEVRFYSQRVDLAVPSAPTFEPAVNVPGELLAVDGPNLYTRQLVRLPSGDERRIHRLVLADSGARIEATHVLGDRVATSLALDGAGHLLVDLREVGAAPNAPDLRVLDADTLEELGQTRVAPFARRLAVRPGAALYSAAEGLALVDLDEPSAPGLQAYLPLLVPLMGPFVQPITTSTLLRDEAFIYLDGGAIQRVALTLENL